MAVVQPIAQSVPAFDAKNSNTFKFVSNGGNQVIANRLVIRNNDSGVEVYNQKIESYRFEHTVPSNTLTNGTYYNFYFVTYDINDNASPNSNVIAFRCYDTPTIEIINIPEDGVIDSTSFTFRAEYNQLQKELLDFAKFILYDQEENVLFESENIYNTNEPPFELSYTFNGLENDTNFKISVKCVTINRTVVESNREIFTTRYFTPSMYSLIELENNCQDGYVKIKNNFKVVDYISNPSNIESKLSDSKLDLTEDGTFVKYYQGFTIEDDFTLKFFIENPNINKFCVLGEGNQRIDLTFIEDYPYGEDIKKICLELQCYDRLEYPYYCYSNFINDKSKLMVWVRRKNNIFDIKLEELE